MLFKDSSEVRIGTHNGNWSKDSPGGLTAQMLQVVDDTLCFTAGD